MKMTWFAIAALLAAAAGCDNTVDSAVCLPVFPPSLSVMVVDSVTNANLTQGTTLVLRDAQGVVADSVTVPNDVVAAGVGLNAAGTFSLSVRKTGYKPWSRSAIKVEGDGCAVHTVPVTTKLQPLG